ncbi:RE1 [Symbiodinium sp. CCMP2592]|nr:RE1 [Symbiodinium sp. CCMP2592]
MDTVSRRRRGGVPEEQETDTGACEAAYQAALSQAGAADSTSCAGVRGEASPGTLELGQGTGVVEPGQMPVANPFHSERVQTEIQLMRNRPPSLDADGQRLLGGLDGGAAPTSGRGELDGRAQMGAWTDDQGAEPDYSAAFAPGDVVGPRVARVETGVESRPMMSDTSFPGTPVNVGGPAAVPAPEDAQRTKGTEKASVATGEPTTEEELVPDASGTGSLEVMLRQVLEENKVLKRDARTEFFAGVVRWVSQEALIAEAAKLLKGVTLKPLRIEDDGLDLTWLRSALTSASDPMFCLVDSGATNALRPASDQELKGAKSIRVDLASGVTDLRVNDYGTLLHGGPCQVILPANYLVELGFSISWKRNGCKIKHPKEGKLEVHVVKGCPLIPRDVGLSLLGRYEDKVRKANGVRKLELDSAVVDLNKGNVRRGEQEGLEDWVQLSFLRVMFPGLPLELLARACVSSVSLESRDWAEFPWNRRMRRSIDRSAPESVLICCGSRIQSWKSCGRVLKVTGSEKGLGSSLVFGHLLRIALTGVVGGVVQDSEGYDWAKGSSDGDKPHRGLVAMLRFFILVAVAQAVKDGRSLVTEDEDLSETLPEGVNSPEGLVQWALAKAADRLRNPPVKVCDPTALSPIFVAWEQFDSFKGSRPSEEPELVAMSKGGRQFGEAYGFHLASFDRGFIGVGEKGVAELWTSSWFLYEHLHLQGHSSGRARTSEFGDIAGSETWPLRLAGVLQGFWVTWKADLERFKEAKDRETLLKRLTEKERYELHLRSDHSPYLKGCPVCVQAQGRRRSHWRTGFPTVHSASFDIAGPFVPGVSFDPVASGRDKGGGYRYFLACSYAVPGNYRPLVSVDKPEGEDKEHEVSRDAAEPELFPELFGELESGVDLKAVTHRVKGKRPEDDPVGAGVGPIVLEESESAPATNTTLFLGVPLRTKGGKEVLGHVQAIINKLEAHGLPVHRFHADRAQELRSKPLVAWMRAQGIHPSWTPGEAPAGNHAELAVQNLKAGTRKLLLTSHVGRQFWPLALLHASARNWVRFFEGLGVPQPLLPPFGVPVEARQRTQTGYEAQWRPRTVRGVYIGQAPHTPGGHLVLIGEGEDRKVLLTSTIFPVRGELTAVPKPRHRLTGKRSSFAVRVVAAADVPTCHRVARLSPGGEPFQPSPEFLNDEEVSGSDESESEVSSEVEDFLEQRDPWVRKGFTAKGSGGERDGPDQGLGGLGDRIQDGIRRGDWSVGECLEILGGCANQLPPTRRTIAQGQGSAVLCGLYAVGGFRGVSSFTMRCPDLVRYLNGFLKNRDPDGVWTTVYLSHNACMLPHRDLMNASEFPIRAQAVGDFKGGGLWLQDDEGTVCRVLPDGSKCPGSVYDLRRGPVVFPGKCWHASEDWIGDRWVLSAFVPREFRSAIKGCYDQLLSLGFPVPNIEEAGGEVPSREKSVASIRIDEPELEEWEVDFPSGAFDDCCLEGLVWEHGATARLCTLLADELNEWSGDADSLCQAVEVLKGEERRRDVLENLLVDNWDVWDRLGSVRALSVDVPLTEHPVTGADQFLQTRTVSLVEARGELGKWREAATEEVVSLETTNRAVDRVTASDVDQWVKEGISVVQLPGKAVLTRKAGTGKRRCRAVCCGNYLPTEQLGLTREELYASGAEALSVKVAVTFAAGYVTWVGVTIDVKSAFLYAPIRTENQGTEERIIVKPPHFLVELGILNAEHRWWIKKALYGLPTSPRDWGRYRDGEFRKLRIPHNGVDYHLVQLKSDDALWVLRPNTSDGLGDIAGILVVYVDDLALFAESELAHQVIKVVRMLWKTSEPEWIGEEAVTFCGLEISRTASGYRLAQSAYIRELLQRYNITEEATVPITKWSDPELPESVTPSEIKEAQAVTGALLWVSTRTRPDISYAVSRCGQMATKVPQLSIAIGLQTIKYLKSTIDLAIEVPFEVGSPFADHGLLALPRSAKVLEVYTDASHSPGGDRSMQSLIVLWKGVPIGWESARQAFTTLSSAEAELVTMVHGVQVSECIQSLLDELLGEDTVVSLQGDNQAALRSFDPVSSGWRSRHLRMRAISARERIDAGILRVFHIPGDVQIADLGTKPLSRPRILHLLNLANIRAPRPDVAEVASARVLSRSVCSQTVLPAELLAGLALLALVPRVKGQPDHPGIREGQEWLFWVVAWIVTAVCVVGAGWFWPGRAVSSVCSDVAEGPEVPVCEDDSAFAAEAQTGSAEGDGLDSDGSSSFDEGSWREAQIKLEQTERSSGLTFVQRARLRKQIAAGGEVEPPQFLQRFGSVPAWFSGIGPEEDPSASSSSGPNAGEQVVLPSRGVSLLGASGVRWELLYQFLGIWRETWRNLRRVNRELARDAVLALLEQWGDTGTRAATANAPEFRAEFVFNGSGWVPVSARFGEIGGSRSPEDPSDSAVQIGGSQSPEDPSDSAVQIGGSQSPEDPSDSAVQIGGSQSPEDPSDSAVQIGGSQCSGNAPGFVIGREDRITSIAEGALGAGFLFRETPREELRHRVGGDARARVRPGDSACSHDVVEWFAEEGLGGSSSSHGMQAAPWPEPTYEDLAEVELDPATWPYIGTWLQTHFVVQILTSVGEHVLWYLGVRSSSWFALRAVSNIVRYAMAGAIVDRLRRGPHVLRFEGPQWFEMTEIFVLQGYPPEPEDQPNPAEGVEQAFPLVLWAPGLYVHYLWRVFSVAGFELLSFLGSRDEGWGQLRCAAQGFMTHSVYAMILWLRATSITRVTDGAQSFDAAEAYLQNGERVHPFYDRDDNEDDATLDEFRYGAAAPVLQVQVAPYAPVFEELLNGSDASSDESGDQTTVEPSVVSLGSEDLNEATDPELGEISPGDPALGAFPGSLTTYEAKPGALVVRYVDDAFEVPLEGWSQSEVEEVVQGLSTGDWAGFKARLEVGDLSQSSGIQSGSSESPVGSAIGGSGSVSVFGRVLWMLLIWWALVQSAGASSVGQALGLPEDSQAVQVWSFEATVCSAGGSAVTSEECVCDGSTLWACVQVALLLGGWEVLRVVKRWWSRNIPCRIAQGTQTDGLYVPLPLHVGVPHRDRILFCLYRAGYPVDVTAYDDETQSGFEWLLGDYLVHLERASEPSSSD